MEEDVQNSKPQERGPLGPCIDCCPDAQQMAGSAAAVELQQRLNAQQAQRAQQLPELNEQQQSPQTVIRASRMLG